MRSLVQAIGSRLLVSLAIVQASPPPPLVLFPALISFNATKSPCAVQR
jgi:hypothetical protein